MHSRSSSMQSSHLLLRQLAVVAAVSLAGRRSVTAQTQQQQQQQQQQQECWADGSCRPLSGDPIQTDCGLYLAESTIPGAGIGIFSAVEKKTGDTIAEGDICIPFIDMYWHNEADFFPNPFRDYFWMGTSMGMMTETDSDDLEAYCPGLDCAVNCHPALLNVDKMTPVYDEPLHRSKDPGAGAITPYHNGTTYVSRDIPAGGELFKDYGHGWFRYRAKIFADLPMPEDYESAQALVNSVFDYELADAATQDLYEIMVGLKPPSSHIDTSFRSRVLTALPNSFHDAQLAQREDIAATLQSAATRPVEHLRQRGKCLDNIRNGPSQITAAGRGAFATRHLKKGTVITASPLHHVDRSFANMYKFEHLDDGSWLRIRDQIVGYQLMLNYCYSHVESTLLLCPYGAGINYINHSPTPNVAIRWARNFATFNESLLNEDYDIFDKVEKPILAFDYVALRDIQQGEEMFMDYGEDWQEAWDTHVANWKPHGKNPDHYLSGRRMNAEFGNSILRTVEEQQYDAYPDHVELRCHRGLLNAQGQTSFRWTINDYGVPCLILDREMRNGEYFYTVDLEHASGNSFARVERVDVPRASIHFFDIPGTSDIHLPNAFRHPIGIPDEIYPEQWKNNATGMAPPATTAPMSTQSASDTMIMAETEEEEDDDEYSDDEQSED